MAKGITGDQGVMIPRDNVKNLVLKTDVVEAINQGRFHIYAVSTVDEGIELLTGVPAGALQENGMYPEDTVHYLVEKRFEKLAKIAREFGSSEAKNEEGTKKPKRVKAKNARRQS